MKRLQLTLTSVPARSEAASNCAFKLLLCITVIMWVVEILFMAFFPFWQYADPQTPKPEGLQKIYNMYNTLVWIVTIFSIVVVLLLRRAVRVKYQIPGNCFRDFCCTLWCRCCVVGQMLRHTTDYDVHPGSMCSSDGLYTPVSPMIV
jgi:Cys-rich protein (TIGR01571 family)